MSEERSIDGPRIERAVREGLIGTPARPADAYAHLFSGRDHGSYHARRGACIAKHRAGS